MQYVITQNVKENLLGKLTGVYYQNTHPYTNNRGNCYIFSIILTRELVSRIDLKEVVIFNSLLKCYVSRAASKMFLWLVLINLLIISVSPTYETKCPLVLSLDLTNGTRLKDGTIVSEGISFAPHLQFKHEGSARGCVCEIKRCIRKCCPPGHAMVNRTCQAYDNDFLLTIHDNDVPLAVASDHFHYVHNSKCSQKGFYRLSPAEYEEDAFYVQQDGKMLMPLAAPGNEILNPEKYCVETFVDETMENISALVCFEEEETKVDSMLSCGMIISMPFLLLTFFVYAILPDRNLHGKALMCYVITLFGAYLTLVFIQLYPDNLSDFNCKTLGISCLFFFMVSFFWMNVMSIDIWWAFSGLRGFSGSKKEAERKRFLLYCGYAWGMPFLHVLIVTSLTLSESLPPNAWYNPGMGDGQCWFREGAPTLVYFYGPMALLTISNIVLFCITAWRIKQVQQDTAMLRKDESKKHTYENDKQRFNLYLKLMLAMGVNWSMEIISWIVDWHFGRMPPAVWYLTDFCNALYGVFIFFIFVFKKNIWKLLKRRYYMIMGKPHLARSMTQTAYSPRTTGSSLSQTVTTDKSFVNDSSILTSEVA